MFQVNCRSIVNKRRALNEIVGELPENTVFFCFTETWLTSNDHDDFYNLKKDQYVCFRFDRAKEGISKKGGGVMLLIPKIFSPKLRKDLNKFSVDFESIWAEIKVNNRKTQNTTLLNVTYSPNKNKTDIFLQQLATNIDNAIVKGHNVILMGDYNINYLNSREKEKLDSILLPYHLEIQNKTEATRICKAGKTATSIDYFISDIYVHKTIVCDTTILSDHFSLCTMLKEETNPLKLVEKKKIYDRSTYNKEKFLDDLKKANWSVIYQQNNANKMLKSFCKNTRH